MAGAASSNGLLLVLAVLLVLCVFYRLVALIMLYALAWRVKDATK